MSGREERPVETAAKYGVQAASFSGGIHVGRLNKACTEFLDKEVGTDMVLAAVAQYVERHFGGGMVADFPGLGLVLEVKVTQAGNLDVEATQ